MSYRELEPMSSVEQDKRRQQLDDFDPRIEHAREKALQAEERDLLLRRIGGRIERCEVLNGFDE